MRLSKTLFIAAAALGTTGAVASVINIEGIVSQSSLSGSDDYVLTSGSRLEINQSTGGTLTGRFLQESTISALPTIVLSGNAVLEYQGWQQDLNRTDQGGNGGYYSGRVFHSGRQETYIDVPNLPNVNNATAPAFSGNLEIRGNATLVVSGYLNQFTDRFLEPEILGVNSVYLSDYARITFQNSPANIVQTPPSDIDSGPYDMNLRYNLVKNVISSGKFTEFQTGLDDTYRINVHIDADVLNGSFGYLRGKGQFIKTGEGALEIRNDGDFSGTVILNGGTTILSSEKGNAIGSAASVNLAGYYHNLRGTMDGWIPGGLVIASNPLRYIPTVSPTGFLGPNGPNAYYGMSSGIADDPENPNAASRNAIYRQYYSVLALESDQTFHNFQSNWRTVQRLDEFFRVDATPTNLYSGSVGTGAGTALAINDSHLTIIQDQLQDGYFVGAITGSASAVLEKRGLGTLALFSSYDPGIFKGLIDIQEGGIIASASALGSGVVNIGENGHLMIVQNNAGTLAALLMGSLSGELRIGFEGFIDNEAVAHYQVKTQDTDGTEAGTLEVNRMQPYFYGNLVVTEGVRLKLTAGEVDPETGLRNHNTFSNAYSIRLDSGETKRMTVLEFGDTNQRVNNFSGDALTKVELGRGTITMVQREVPVYEGVIAGAGNLVLLSDAQFMLTGANAYFGATVVNGIDENSKPMLVLGRDGGNAIQNTSALILYAGATVVSTADGSTALPQHIGMLFGEKGSKLVMGDAELSIGVDKAYLLSLERELASLPVSAPDAQPAYFFNTTIEGDADEIAVNPKIRDFTMGTSRYYLSETLAQMAGRGLSADVVEDLAFAGEIVGTASIRKIGDQRLTFNGVSPQFYGSVKVEDGFFRLNYDSLPNAQNIEVLTRAQVEVNVRDTDGIREILIPIIGPGDIAKVGTGTLRLTNYQHTGNTYVKEGALILSVRDNLHDIILGDINVGDPSKATNGTVFIEVASGRSDVYSGSLKDVAREGVGLGNVVKIGPGTLVLRDNPELNYIGLTTVEEGELIFEGKQGSRANLPSATNDYQINAGAVLTMSIVSTVSTPTIEGDILGAGAFRKDGDGILEIRKVQDGFTGATLVHAGDLSLCVEDALAQSSGLSISSDARVFLNGYDQTFKNLTGDSNAELILGTAKLTFNTSEEKPQSYDGKVSGAGNIIKNGDGTLSMRGDNTGLFTGTVTINAGVYETTTRALGEGTVVVETHGTLQFYSDGSSGVDIYTKGIEGVGTVSKTGAGVVHLSWDATSPTVLNGTSAMPSSTEVREGVLIVDSARNMNEIPLANVFAGATLQINLQADDVAYSGQIKGAGNLVIDGQLLELGDTHSMRLHSVPLYTGVTKLQNGAIFDVSEVDEIIGGIGADQTSMLILGSRPNGYFYIGQSSDAEFSGTIAGFSSLEISGPGILKYLAPDGSGNLDYNTGVLGSVSLNGGNLQVGIHNTHQLSLNTDNDGNESTLYINVRDGGVDSALYEGEVFGEGNVFKTGAGALNVRDLLFLDSSNFSLDTLGVNEGRLVIDAAWLSTPGRDDINFVSTGTGKLVFTGGNSFDLGRLSGAGLFEVSTGRTSLRGKSDFSGQIYIATGGVLAGSFETKGGLLNEGLVSIGNSIGEIKLGGNFVQGASGVLEIEIDGKNCDTITYGGVARLSGKIEITNIGSAAPVRGMEFNFVKNSGASDIDITDLFVESRDANSNVNYILVGAGLGRGTAYERFGQQGLSILVAQKHLARVDGYVPHQGLGEFLTELDRIATTGVPLSLDMSGAGATRQAVYAIGSYVNAAPAVELAQVVNNFSPLGYGSLLGMPAGAGHSSVEHLHGRLEQRRYDHALYSLQEWQAYVSATSTFANHGDGTKDPVYNYSINGGVIGVDRQFSESDLLGGSVEYSHGTAQMHEGGGKMRMSAVRLSAYWSHSFSEWFFLDVGVNGGYLGYDVKRETPTGQNTAEPEGWSLGTFATVSTVFPLMTQEMKLHAVPYVGVEYGHYVVNAFEEAGSVSRLGVEKFGYDTLRAKIGSGLNWEVEGDWEWQWRVGLNAAFAQELLDVESEVDAAFAQAGGGKFRVKTRVQTRSSVQIGPSVSVNLNDRTSVYANYRLEVGFDGATYNNINLGFRTRF